MLIRQLNITSEKNSSSFEWAGSTEVYFDKKRDIQHTQQMQLLETELSFIPSEYYNVIRRIDKEIYDLISEKYPEWLMNNQQMLEDLYKI